MLSKMQLYISDGSRPDDVKRFFSFCYPFLKIELYRMEETDVDTPRKKRTPIGNKFTDLCNEGFIDIHNEITVAQLITSFAHFGLKTEIFRKFGNLWIETSLTDNWTLQQQNKAGEEITNDVRPPSVP